MIPTPSALEWRGLYIVHHGDQDRLLHEMVLPCTVRLLRDGLVRRFFWIRYHLGGPHVRLRLELDPVHAPAAAARVHAEAAAFFRHAPSATRLDDGVIRSRNRGILTSDPQALEVDDLVFENNSVVEAPVRFEVDRYGGPELIDHSCDLFTVSSIVALDFVASYRGRPASERLLRLFHLLVQQGWGHANDASEFVRVIGYGARRVGEPWGRCMAAADLTFARQRELLCSVLRAELVELAESDGRPELSRGAQELTNALAPVGAARREEIGASHLHMTANRLGLSNPEEVYLSRILVHAAEAVAETDPGWWSEIWGLRRQGGGTMPDSSEVVPRSLARLAMSAGEGADRYCTASGEFLRDNGERRVPTPRRGDRISSGPLRRLVKPRVYVHRTAG